MKKYDIESAAILKKNKKQPQSRQSIKTPAFLTTLIALSLLLLILPAQSQAKGPYLSDVLSSFTDTSRNDVCGSCHADWTGAGSRNDFALDYKIWDYNLDTGGMTPNLLERDTYRVGTINQAKVNNQSADQPFPFLGASDKDGDGYINLYYQTDISGRANNVKAICVGCSIKGPAGGSTGGLPVIPLGWDIDDNDPLQGNVPWGTGDATPYYSTDTTIPALINNFVTNALVSHQIPLTWTAPADDDPAASDGTTDITLPVYSYDIRYTTQDVVAQYDLNYGQVTPGMGCNISAEDGDSYCDVRNVFHWERMWRIADCGINNGGSQPYVAASGVKYSNSCIESGSSELGWNRGIASPLMRALYETAPSAPGITENYTLQEITSRGIPTNTFATTDSFDGTISQPNYIADGQTYWIAIRSTDGTVRPAIETTDSDNDGVLRDGPFLENAGGGAGINSLDYAGTSEISNIIAITAGPEGAAITGFSPNILSTSSDVSLTIDGLGLTSSNAAQVSLYSSKSQYFVTSTSIDYTNAPQQLVATFADLSTMTPGAYTLQIERLTVDETGIEFPEITAAWVDAIILSEVSNNAGIIQFDANGYLVNEISGIASIKVTRHSGSSGAVAIDYVTADGTATAGSDYLSANGTLTWADGISGTQLIHVTITDDTLLEGDETLTLTLSNPIGGVTLDTTNTATLTIVDNEATGSIELTSSNITVDEFILEAGISVARIGGSTGEITVNYSTSDGTALAGTDYIAQSGTVTWLDGDSSIKTIIVPILDDTIFETDEIFSVVLSDPTGAVAFTGITATTVTILDDDQSQSPGTLQFSSSKFYVDEDGGAATITVSRIDGSFGELSIDYTTSDNTATVDDNDYVSSSGTFVWADGDTTVKTFTVSINDDSRYEGLEILNLALNNPLFNGIVDNTIRGSQITAALSIVDNDTGITFKRSTLSIFENDDVLGIRFFVEGNLENIFTFDYRTTNDTAIAGSDYTSTSGSYISTQGSVYIDGSKIPYDIIIPITDDLVVEDNETFTFSINNLQGADLIGPNTLTIIIFDDDAYGSLVFSTATSFVDEGDGSATISVSRVGGITGDVSVDYATSNGTAKVRNDYLASSGTLFWAEGDSSDKTFSITIKDDNKAEDVESIILDLSSATGGAVLGNPASATLNIIDNDSPSPFGQVAFSSASYSVTEDVYHYYVTVSRVDGSYGSLTVEVFNDKIDARNTATVFEDYYMGPYTLYWADGDTADKTFRVRIYDDTLEENNEGIVMTLVNITGGGTIGDISTAILTIVDNDSPASFQIDADTYSVTEDDGNLGNVVTISVSRLGTSVGAVSVDYATADGTALSADDYMATVGTLYWADGESGSKTLSVSIYLDTLVEEDESFTVSLSNAVGAILPTTATTTTTVTIIDNDTAKRGGGKPKK